MTQLTYQFHVNYVIFLFVIVVMTPIFVHSVYAEDKNVADLVWIPQTIKVSDSIGNIIPKVWDSLSISADVQNIGNSDTMPAHFSLKVLDDQNAVVFQSTNDAELKIGQTSTMKYDWVPSTRGTYKIVFDADSTDNVVESNEANNHYERT